MRIKIIGNNDCARATRQLLRQAGFAVTEFLPAEVVTHAPHAGFAITIDVVPAPATPPDPSKLAPDLPTQHPPATRNGEMPSSAEMNADGGVSSPAISSAGTTWQTPSIHFDSVDSPLEAAILSHVTQLSSAPVILDRPGGLVHSERELRIVVRQTGIPQSDEESAMAVEFGVLRGLLDLADPQGQKKEKFLTSTAPSLGMTTPVEKRKKWWKLFSAIVFLVIALAALAGLLQPEVKASPRTIATRSITMRGAEGAYLHLEALLAPAPAQAQFASGQMNLALVGGSAVSGSLYDSGNTALKVNCVVGCGATSAFSDGSAFTAGSTSVNNISAVFNDSIATLSSGNAGALRSTTDRMLFVNIGKLGGTALSGANVVDAGNTAFRVNCVTGCSASAGFTDNSAFTAGTTSESNVGGVFNDGLGAVTSGNAAAARITASRAVHVNLRNNAGTEIGTASTPVRTDPTGTTTQPVSGTVTTSPPANASSNIAQVGGTATDTNSGNKSAGTIRVVIATDQPALTNKLLVTPDSVALPANQSVNVSQINGVTPLMGNGTTGTGSQRVTVASDNTAFGVKSTDGTNTAIIDPCQGQTKVYSLISITSGTQIVTGTSAKKQYICAIQLVSATAQNIALVEGTGTVCATSTLGLMGGASAATGWNLAANGGLTFGNGASAIAATTVNANNVCVLTSSSGQISGSMVSVPQ